MFEALGILAVACIGVPVALMSLKRAGFYISCGLTLSSHATVEIDDDDDDDGEPLIADRPLYPAHERN